MRQFLLPITRRTRHYGVRMAAPLDQELAEWAREHLVYEARMLAYTAVRLAERRDLPRDHESNLLLEGLAIHARCLRDFLWGNRSERHPMDAFAVEFCAPGEWEKARGAVPAALAEVDERNRFGREVVHLSYDRRHVQTDIKDSPVSEIVGELVEALDSFAATARSECLDDETAIALSDLTAPLPKGVGPISVATAVQVPYTGGTINFPDFSVGS